jgi:hypothetical protein
MDKYSPETEFLVEIQTKVLIILVIHSHLYSFASRFLLLQTHATSYSFCKGRNLIEKTIPSSYGFRNPYRNLKSERKLSRLCPETLMVLYFHEFGFRRDNVKLFFFYIT